MAAVERLPEGAIAPSNEEMADLLTAALDEADRPEARRLLIETVFPALVGDVSDHPNPRAVAQIVYDELADSVEGAPPEGRLSVIRAAALRAEILEHSSAALALAMARYLKENPAALDRAADLPPAAAQWLQSPVEGIENEARRRLEALEDWRERAQAHYPWLWETYRVKYLHAQLDLEAALSGSFEAAAGALHDFLSGLGVQVQSFDIA